MATHTHIKQKNQNSLDLIASFIHLCLLQHDRQTNGQKNYRIDSYKSKESKQKKSGLFLNRSLELHVFLIPFLMDIRKDRRAYRLYNKCELMLSCHESS